ncbi:MAG: thermonuclease family protein [Burkholderiales bacterium]
MAPGRETAITVQNVRHLPLIPALALLAAAVFSQAVAAETLHGRVVRVADGDTVTVLVAGRVQHTIRLAGIVAPEKTQPYGDCAKRLLSDLVFGAEVDVEYDKRDRHGRIVGKVVRDGQDASLSLIEAGYAWYFKRYAAEQSKTDRASYARAEEAARHAKKGLWSEPTPQPPWEWRTQRRSTQRSASVARGAG